MSQDTPNSPAYSSLLSIEAGITYFVLGMFVGAVLAGWWLA